MQKELSQKRLKQLLDYDSETGFFRWKESGKTAGSPTMYGYRTIWIEGRSYRAHRVAWLWMTGRWPKNQMDHIDRNRSNNKFSNLRECGYTDNAANKIVKTNKLGYKGVHIHKNGYLYIAQIQKNNRKIYLGLFPTPEEAHAAYCAAANKLFGAFARTS